MSQTFYSDLLPTLAERAKVDAISRLGFSNAPLQRHLAAMFDRPYGQPGAFLADPSFEAVFGWRKSDQRMADLVPTLLTEDLVRAMDQPPADLVRDYRFERGQFPYIHQVEAWRILAQGEPQSLVVASGTGSGKTECFMVPILDRLVRLRQEGRGRLVGVRALFLYPLNALINSQRERLRAWTHGFEGDIRFCLYNGNTPERPDPAHIQRQQPGEVMDRQSLRASPPPILVTNATMLEYMLVRTADAPILTQSQGKLEWVVLDEAHTYVGSQAAEAALLIRRVLFAFGVTPDQVRFVATSATIGDPEGEAGQILRRFLAEVAGVELDRVHLVAGLRSVPSLKRIRPAGHNPVQGLAEIEAGLETSTRRYDSLVDDVMARRVRELFVGAADRPPVARLSAVCGSLFGARDAYSLAQQREALRWLDLLSGTRDNTGEGSDDGEAFLPLRAHLFHQTLSGIWACADSVCIKKAGSALDDSNWPFGQVYLEPRKHCDCGSPAYEVVSCGECGMAHLLASDSSGSLVHLQPQAALDEFELDVEPQGEKGEDDTADDEEAAEGRQHKILIVNRPLSHVGPLFVDRLSRRITEGTGDVLRVLAHEDDGSGLSCPGCGGHEDPAERLFQYSRLGAPFLLGSILPTLLEFAPDSEKPAEHPCRGRRLLTFSDSRQGTARIAAKLQQEAERNRVRGLVYHLALQHGRNQGGAQANVIQENLAALELIPTAARNEGVNAMITQMRQQLAVLANPVPIPFNDLANQLANQGRDFDYMLKHYRRLAPDAFSDTTGPVELARMFLVREFGRRPKRLNNLETMGLVAVRYPGLDGLAPNLPGAVQDAGFDRAVWLDFLKICLDFFVRGGGSLAVTPSWRSWLGMPFPQRQLVQRDEANVARNQRRWPRARRRGLRSTLVRLLAHVLKADITIALGEDRVDAILLAAWDALIAANLLRQGGDGRVLALESLAFSPMTKAWICPVTRRFLDTTIQGVTPYLPQQATDSTALCQEVALPLYDEAFSGVTDDLERIRRGRAWLAAQESIAAFRERGVWSSLNDRVIELAPYFTAAEHSAQQDSKKLDRYEKAFKAGDLNLLSCSTTMEMGIDIGGISQVAMNNVPPHPANYLQRAGRAGRRRESRSLAMTLCKSNPHDQAVFSNTRWAFDTAFPAPRVSLDSRIIVQRHVQSLLLSRFLAVVLLGAGQEQMRLACGAFFIGDDSLAGRFSAWCRGFSPEKSGELAAGLRQLLRHSVFEGADLNGILDDAAEVIDELARSWRQEWTNLATERDELAGGGVNSPAYRAVSLRVDRLSGEYLLRELATRGFLPAYGFPTHIAPFDNLTRGQFLQARQHAGRTREDNRYQRRELASRDLMTALREYAPGSEVVMDGLVYRSAGVTLNWHIPADQQGIREIQDIRHAWRCNRCGASGSSSSLETARHCDACGADTATGQIREFLAPAGFAVDFYKEPSNDISTQHFVPVEKPWIDARGDWFTLPNPGLGSFRVSVDGHVFHQSRGIHGNGYAICLECGRAEPMQADQSLPSAFQQPHSKLRRSQEDGLICRGSADAWKVKAGLTLGHETWTDVFELQLKSERGAWLFDVTTAMTLAVVLRDALAELLGVQATELGCDIKEGRPESGTRCHSILIFDRFAAGYSSSAERYLGTLFHHARRRLECPANCDSACPHCVLDFDQRFAADSLNRGAALEFLSDAWLNSLRLPDEYAYFGVGSIPEYRRLPEAIWSVVSAYSPSGVRLFAAGSPVDWDVSVSPLRELAYRLAGNGVAVQIVVPVGVMGVLDDADRFVLASLADHPNISIHAHGEPPRCGHGWLIAETLDTPAHRWGLGALTSLNFGSQWGIFDGPLVRTGNGTPLPAAGTELKAETIRPQQGQGGPGDCEIEIQRELNGPIRGFGKRFWQHLAASHPATNALIASAGDTVASVAYRDRYLFAPIAVALLVEVLSGLREVVGAARWSGAAIEVVTTNRRSSGENKSRNTVWADWLNPNVRDMALVSAFRHVGLDASVATADNSGTGHGRLLELKWSSGKIHTVRLDQGVSYWRAARSNSRRAVFFDTEAGASESLGRQVVEIAVQVEGATLPTQLFLKVR
ncbi:MAG: DUF1998 domain-containing protein [Candidatus Accumulibacter meliphilus]|jgi:hypothetical protein|uniref:DUF1998 domain-containing protein n=1 Tax=Candidatus Accumulibacter meliphilus TaxID=2211374 RepID=A0A369XK99_9PROT|nr:MAG: DUF1998 domain-containing protein [Candidatus Accumulibacter meliphilus]